MCEKSVAQLDTGPVMISLRMPLAPSCLSHCPATKRLPTAISGALDQPDRVLRAVEHSTAGALPLPPRHHALTLHLPLTPLLPPPHVGGKVRSTPLPLAPDDSHLEVFPTPL